MFVVKGGYTSKEIFQEWIWVRKIKIMSMNREHIYKYCQNYLEPLTWLIDRSINTYTGGRTEQKVASVKRNTICSVEKMKAKTNVWTEEWLKGKYWVGEGACQIVQIECQQVRKRMIKKWMIFEF